MLQVDGGTNQEYGRFKKEIEDSQAFDRMKTELGFKEFKKLVRDKVRPISLDLVSCQYNSIAADNYSLNLVKEQSRPQ